MKIIHKKFLTTVKTKYIFLDLLFALFKFQMQKVQKIKKKVNLFMQQRLIIFGINKIFVSYCLSSNISDLLSKSHFQSKTRSFVHKKLNI